jgi:SH3-like domain-containing protein
MRKSVPALALALVISLDAVFSGSVLAAPVLGAQTQTGSVSSAAIVQTALRYLGYPYTTVGNSPSTGFSCIGFVSYVYQANGIPLPDDLGSAMAYAPSIAFSDLLPGDVLFFQNTVWAGLSHTAIYLGDGRFVHAAWYNTGVIISSFTNDLTYGDYWMSKYLGANRPWTAAATSSAPTPASSPSALSTPARAAQPQLRAGPGARVQVPGLNVRVRPSLFAPIRRLVSEGTSVVLVQQYRSWIWVQFPDGSYGWVAGAGIGAGSTTHGRHSARTHGTTGQPAGQPRALAAVQVNGLRVHTRPNTTSPVLASAFRGQRLNVFKRWNGWLWVLMPNGTGGWVSGSFVGPGAGQRTGSGRRAAATKRLPVRRVRATGPVRRAGSTITAGVRLRYRPSLRAPVLGLVAAGTHVQVLAAWGKWVYVRFRSGRSGWVYRAYVRS